MCVCFSSACLALQRAGHLLGRLHLLLHHVPYGYPGELPRRVRHRTCSRFWCGRCSSPKCRLQPAVTSSSVWCFSTACSSPPSTDSNEFLQAIQALNIQAAPDLLHHHRRSVVCVVLLLQVLGLHLAYLQRASHRHSADFSSSKTLSAYVWVQMSVQDNSMDESDAVHGPGFGAGFDNAGLSI